MVLTPVITTLGSANIRRWLALSVIVIAVFGLAVISNSDRHRYSVRLGPCYYHQLYVASGDIDLLVLGGSSMMAAVDPVQLSDALAGSGGDNDAVLNLAQPWYGADAVYQLFDEITVRRKTKNALIMVRLDGASSIHRRAYVTWRWKQLWATLASPGASLIERTSDVLRLSMKRLRDSVFHPKGAVDRYRRDPDRYLHQFTGPNTCFRKNLADAERVERMKIARERVLRDGLRTIDVNLNNAAFAYPLHYLQRLKALADQRQVNIVFIRMPDLWQHRWSERTRQTLSDMLGAPLVEMPIDLRWQIFNADGYRDERHLVTSGRELFTPWLAGALAPRLSPGR